MDDPRAQVFRPIEGGIKFVDAVLAAFDEWSKQIRKKGKAKELSANCKDVLAQLLRRGTDFRTGVSEPALDTLMRWTGLARATVVRALAILRQHGWLDWVRRTAPTDNAPGDGPQVRQVSNAYFFDLTRLHKRVVMAIRARLRKEKIVLREEREPRVSVFKAASERRRHTTRSRRADLAAALAGASSPAEKAALLYPGDPGQQASWLAVLAEAASSGTGLNPSPSTER